MIGLATIMALGGCQLGPAYKAPTLDTPATYRATSASAAAAWPSRTWWEGFHSPDLDKLIAGAEQNNFDLQAAIARVRQADAQVRISGAPLLPSISGTGTYNWDRSSTGRSTSRNTNASTAGTAFTPGNGIKYLETRSYGLTPLSASYELDFWGKLRATQESAEASALFSRFDQQTVALTAVSSVATTWFQALADKDRLDIAERNLKDAEETLAAIQARFDVGTASLLDLSQQQALAAGVRANIPSFRSQLQQQINALGILIGQPPESITVTPGTLNTLDLPEVAAGLPSELLQRRPDIAAAEAQLIAQNANIRAARAAFFPSLQLTGSAGWESAALGTVFGPGAFFASAAATASQTIFDNGLLGGQYEQTQARYDELAADYRKAVVQAFTDVENALTAYRFATEQETLQRDAVTTAQLAADIARAQVAAGTIDLVTALNTETTLFNDLDTLAQVRLARFLALVDLYKALGGGWAKSDVIVPPSTIYHGVL